MSQYLLELYMSQTDARATQDRGGSARDAAEELSRRGTPVSYRHSISRPEPSRRARPRSLPGRPSGDSRQGPRPRPLDPESLPDHIDALYRAAWALCGSRHDAEDLVQETFANVLKRPRLIRDDNDLGYLLRALRNTHANRWRAAAQHPATRQLFDEDAPARHESSVSAREIMEAIASAPALYRDAVIAVDMVGLSYREAARCLRTREATITTRLHRGRQHVARRLSSGTPPDS